jgi:DNA-binding FadR family transcriptional regulator
VTNAASDGRFNVRVPKTAELVAAHIRRQIVRGDLEPGYALPPETVLMEEFTISRPSLREAFRILESEGLIIVRRGARGGARVQVPTGEAAARYAGLVLQYRGATLADVLEARVIVEAPAAGIVARRRDRSRAAAELQRSIDESPPIDDPAYSSHFHEFNRLVVALTESETLVLLTTMLESISDLATARYMAAPHPDDLQLARKANRTRAKLVQLVAEGSDDAAETLWRTHLNEAGRALLRTEGSRVVDLVP